MKHISLNISWVTCLFVPLFMPAESAAFGFYSTTKTTEVDITKTAKRMADCVQFKLKLVQGGPADTTRVYWFNGICKIWVVKYVGGKEQGTSGEASLWAEAKVTWNAQSNELQERVKLTDPGNKHSGTLELNFKCMQDPIVQKSNCVRLSFKNLTDWTGFEVPQDKNQPMLAGQTTQAEVAALTKTAVPSAKPNVSTSVGSAPASNPMGAPVQVPAGPIGGPAPRPTSQTAGQSGRATNATRQSSTLSAVQNPAPTTGMAGAPARATPSWSGLGGQIADAAAPAASNAGAVTPSAGPGMVRGVTTSVSRELASASCTAATGGLRFSCATRIGFDRCESLRRARKVEQCTLDERR